MFTGIVEAVGTIGQVVASDANRHFCVASSLAEALRVEQSVSHNGACLTVTRVENGCHWVTAVAETLQKTTLGKWTRGDRINLERCMPANGRFDGHIVQGHVDQAGVCSAVQEAGGSWLFDFEYDASSGNILVEKGSVCVDGVSLTCFQVTPHSFRVAIIPYTFEHTHFKNLKPGTAVNLEFDVIGKYVQRLLKIPAV